MKLATTTRKLYLDNKDTIKHLLDAISLRGNLSMGGMDNYDSSTDNIIHLLDFTRDDFGALEKFPAMDLINKKPIKLVTFHIGCCGRDYGPDKNGREDIIGEVLTKQQILKMAYERIELLKKRFSGVIAGENIPNLGTHLYDYVCEPEFIRKIIKQHKIMFLFDTGHAEVSAKIMGCKSVKSYIDALPLDKTYEIHVHKAGIWKDGKIGDMHHPPDKEEFKMIEYVKGVAQPEYLTYEYAEDENLNVVISTLKALRKLC